MDIEFPNNYPMSPPKVKFRTRIYHLNVSTDMDICLDILKHNWSPVLSIDKVLLSISSLLEDPNPEDPYRSDLALLYKSDYSQYFANAKEETRKYARLDSEIDF